MDQYKGWQQYQIRGDVDNQLGHLHGLLRRTVPKQEGFDLQPYNDKHPNAFIVKNVVPKNLAKEVRRFLNAIPFDNTLQKLDDTTNPSKEVVVRDMNDAEKTQRAYSNKVNDHNKWTWERYHNDFWRALPLTPEAFCGSPIVRLIDLLEEKWYATKINNLDIKKYKKATWVIQRIEEGHGIDLHSDDNKWRRLAFVYYLTPGDWDYKQDGGELCVCYDDNKNNHMVINPQFNTMVVWEMVNQKGPQHFVSPVKTKTKSRIALVGFFAEY
jgi:hypothetical protein